MVPIRRLGQGGMGEVFLAENEMTRTRCAVKIMFKEMAAKEALLRRFALEARTVKMLNNPHIVALYDYAESPVPYMVMEYVEGINLSDRLSSRGTLTYDEALKVFLQAARALAHAHEHDVIHRDLKPSNIMFLEGDDNQIRIKLLDFGISKMLPSDDRTKVNLTATGEVLGTPSYMAPEQCTGKNVDHRADIYGLGCLMYEALTGEPPFTGTDPIKILAEQATLQVPDVHSRRPDLPQDLRRILMRTVEKKPSDRYQTMNDLIRDLEKLRSGATIIHSLTGTQKAAVGKSVNFTLSLIMGFCSVALILAIIEFATHLMNK